MLLGPFRVLGTASRYVSQRKGNPDHDRSLPFGDPPCGSYRIAASLPPGSVHPRRPGRFGKLGALLLEPTGGDALQAVASGRERVVLHGGRQDAQRRLRRTRGGLRLPDQKLSALFQAINQTQSDGDPLSVIEVVDVGSGFEAEPALPPAHRRGRRRHPNGGTASSQQGRTPTISAAGIPVAAVTAMALFGIKREPPTRRRFLAAALLAVTGATGLPACDSPAPCARVCTTSGSGSASGSGSSAGSGSTAGSGSSAGPLAVSAEESCTAVCDYGDDDDGDDYGAGGGAG